MENQAAGLVPKQWCKAAEFMVKFRRTGDVAGVEDVMNSDAGTIFQFAGFTLDLARGALREKGEEITLRPKTYEVLCHLARNPGRIVTKDEMLKSVWPNVFVTEDSLVRCIHEIRQALRDTEQRMIRTLPRRGYLFDIAVSAEVPGRSVPSGTRAADHTGVAPSDPVPIGLPHWRRQRRLLQSATLAAIVFAAIATAAYIWRPAAPKAQHTSIAVLPFVNEGGDTHYAHLANALTEDVIVNLSKFSGITVAGRNAVAKYERQPSDVRAVGRDLAVRYVLEGTIRADGTLFRLSTQLVDAATGKQLWAERYDRPVSNSVSAHDEICREIAATLAGTIKKATAMRVAGLPPTALSVQELVVRAGELSANYPDKTSALEARALLRQAIVADPSNVSAYELLGREYYRGYVLQWDGPEALDYAFEFVQRAISLDNASANAYDLLGRIYLRRRQYDLAIMTIEKAIALNPNRAEGYASLADTYTFAGRPEEAVDLLEKAKRLNPLYPPYFEMYLGRAHYFSGRYEKALLALETCVARGPGYRPCYMYLAPVYAELGETEKARQAVKKLLAVSPGFTIETSVRRHLPFVPARMQFFISGLRKAGVPE